MNISVVGLGVEGQQATLSLLYRGHDVYSSDINRKIDLSLLNEKLSENLRDKLDLEIGSHNLDKIYKSDAVAVSPSLFNKKISKDIIDRNIFISDVLNNHKDITTIAVTGTNGKTTTSHMIYDMLVNNGHKVVIGGNGGGGFKGYIDLLLEANTDDYEFMVIEVCDMTLEFCKYVFDIDLIVVTNIGYDHMDVHGSIEHYTQEVIDFIGDKACILNKNDENLQIVAANTENAIFFDEYPEKINLFGKFNLQNAHAAYQAGKILNINDEKELAREFMMLMPEKLGKFTEAQYLHAIRAGFERYHKYHEDLRKEADRIVEEAHKKGMRIMVLAGRPYHVDPEINHGIDLLAESLGFAIITEDSIAYRIGKIPTKVLNQWTYHARLYSAAEYVTERDDMELVQLVSFGCGIDAITTDEVRAILERKGRIYTQIKIDEINNLSAVNIRLRSLLGALEMRDREK